MQNELKKQTAIKVQNAAGNRYRTLLFYESICKRLAWFLLITGLIVGVIYVIQLVDNNANWEAVLVFAVCWFIGCGLSWLSLMVTANLIKAFVDIAVNSFVSTELQKFD